MANFIKLSSASEPDEPYQSLAAAKMEVHNELRAAFRALTGKFDARSPNSAQRKPAKKKAALKK